MALRLEGDRTMALPLDQVWPKLSDASFLVHCIPDAVIQGEPGRERAQCTVRPNLAFAKGDMQVTIQILEAREPNHIRFSIVSKGVGSTNEMETALALAAKDATTQIHWVTDIRLGGLLKLAPSGLIRGAAQKVSDDIWNEIEKQMK